MSYGKHLITTFNVVEQTIIPTADGRQYSVLVLLVLIMSSDAILHVIHEALYFKKRN